MMSCTQNSQNPERSVYEKGFPLGLLGFNINDTVYALLRYDYTDRYEAAGNVEVNAAVQAFLADSVGFVNATSVSVNSQSLTNVNSGSTYVGQYHLNGPIVGTGQNPTASWNVVGYLGSTFDQLFSLAPRFNISSFEFLDTVSISNGYSRSYSNLVSGDSIEVLLLLDSFYSSEYIHPDSTTGSGDIGKVVGDNGSISFTSSELANFTPYRIYNLIIQRAKYETSSYQGKKIGLVSRHSETTMIYLVP